MTIDERLELMGQRLDMMIKIHLDNDREYRERFAEIRAAIEQINATARQDGENIRALARIAEIHERRLSDLEGLDE